MLLPYYWTLFCAKFRMKYLVTLFFIPPVCGLIAGFGLSFSIPELIATQYKVSLTLQSFYYTKSYWDLSIEDLTAPESITHHSVLLEHGPWLGENMFGLANVKNARAEDLPIKASLNLIGTLSYDLNASHAIAAIPHLQGMYHAPSGSHTGFIQGSFFFNNSYCDQADIEYIYEKNIFTTPALSLVAQINRFQGPSEHDLQISGLKIHIIPDFGSSRGSWIVSMHADSWSFKQKNLLNMDLDVAIMQAKTKRLSHFLSMMTSTLPQYALHDAFSLNPYGDPQDFIDVVDLIDPEWAYVDLYANGNQWNIRVSEGGESIHIEATGSGTALYALWDGIFPHSFLTHLNTQSPSWATEDRSIRLSSYNFEPATWSLAKPINSSMQALDS